ncbi:hypothetical protein B0H19DRAFT_1263451 [Mycena capillaripes]|nr:hypothetical protein B0H19DRAFT_1263451 [Mycena capillaripes]
MAAASQPPAGTSASRLEETVNPGEIISVDFDTLIANELAQRAAESEAEPHSVFAEIDAEGHLCHKKTLLRTLFDTTIDAHSSHDRLNRVRGFTIGGKSWAREDNLHGERVSPATHFQLGNLFTYLICYNGAHLGLAVAKCTPIKRGPLGSKSPSISAIPRDELHLPASPYTITGQILDLMPVSTAEPLKWAWNGKFVSLSFTKTKKVAGKDEISRLKNLQFVVPSPLIHPIHEKAEETLVSDVEIACVRRKTWAFLDSDLLDSWYNLWNRLFADSELHDKFPKFDAIISDGIFPYQVAAHQTFDK